MLVYIYIFIVLGNKSSKNKSAILCKPSKLFNSSFVLPFAFKINNNNNNNNKASFSNHALAYKMNIKS